MPSLVRYWLRSSREDLRAAETLLLGGHSRLAIFCCHLSVEKALEAVLQQQTGRLPPRLHDLRTLLARTGLVPPVPLQDAINRLAALSIPTRYPGPLSTGPLGLRKRTVEQTIRQSGKVVHWCREQCH